MYLSDIFRRSGRNLRQAKARTILTALAIAVGAFALTLTLAASNGATAFTNKIISDNFDPAELIVVRDPSTLNGGTSNKPQEFDGSFGTGVNGSNQQVRRLTDEDVAKLKAMPGISQMRFGGTVNLQYITREGQKKYVGTLQALRPSNNPELLAGQATKPLADHTVLLPEAYLSVLGFKNAQEAVGKELSLAVRQSFTQASLQKAVQDGALQNPDQIQSLANGTVQIEAFTIAGVLKKPTTSQPGTDLYLLSNEPEANRLQEIATKNTTDYHKYTVLYVHVRDGADKTKLKAVQDKLKADGYGAQSVQDTEKFLTQIISVLRGIVVAFGLISVIASVFGVVNTMYISVLQRTREIGLMKALGMRKRDVSRLFRFEAAWIGFLGGAFGSLAAFLLGQALNPWITTKLNLGAGQKLLIYHFPQIAGLIILLVLVAIFAGLFPARRAAKLDPIEALRTE